MSAESNTEQHLSRNVARTKRDPLLQPFTLKGLVLRNRLLSTSHAIGYHEEGKPKRRYQLYHEEKAKGGIALTMFGGSSNVASDSASVFGQLYVGDDSILPYFEQLSTRVHKHGAALMCQLTHLGARSHWAFDNWLPTIGPSRFREQLHRAVSKEMDRHDIGRVVTSFAEAALRCQTGNLDGIELCAHGHLIGQFWSRHTNHRTDSYGGSIENRCRFGLQVLEGIRSRVGPDFIVGLRMPIDEEFAEGLSYEECLEIAQRYTSSGLIDFLNLNHGHIDTAWGLSQSMPGMAAGSAPVLEKVGVFRRSLKLPVFHACRIADIATARHAIGQGLVDMIGMTRAHIADPHIAQKISAGEEEQIRPCVGATYCSTRRLCIHNPASGREETMPHTITATSGPALKCLIVGGGPAGLEAARVLSLRGHEVVLFEAANEVGGQVVLAARAPSRRDLIGIVEWRKAQIEQRGVRLHLNRYVEVDDVLAEKPDVVVVSTGGISDIDWVKGAEHCTSTWDALSGAAQIGHSVFVYDAAGTSAAISCVQYLASRGAKVEMATMDEYVGQDVGYLERPFFLKDLFEKNVVMSNFRQLVRVEARNDKKIVSLRNELTGLDERREIDTVIVERGTVPNDTLFHDLRSSSLNDGVTDIEALIRGEGQEFLENPDGKFRLFRIGDAVAARDIHASIYDALRLCKDI